MKRAVLLARQSLKKSPDSVSIPEQIAGMKRYCAEKGYAVVGVIASENVRGTRERDRRADLTEIEALADDGQFDVLITWKLDRLARYLRVQENVIYELERHGVGFESATEPIVNSVMGRQVLGMMAEQFSRDLSQRLTSVVSAHVRMGKHMGKAPLGYVRGDDDHLRICPERAAAARSAFAWKLEGLGSPAIKERLQADYGVRLSEPSILRLLANPVYLGCVTGPNGLLVEAAHEPLIDRATFDAVQTTLNHRRAVRQKRETSWLEGLVFCGCGLPMYLVYNGTTWRDREYINWKFRCKSTLGNGATPCDQPVKSISKRKLEAAALAQLTAQLRAFVDHDVTQLIADAEAKRQAKHPGWQHRQKDLSAKRAKLLQRQDAINEARLDNRMSREDANTRYRQAEKELAAIDKELSSGPRPVDPDAIVELHAVAVQLAALDLSEVAAEAPDLLRTFLRKNGVSVMMKRGVPKVVGFGDT